MTPKNVLFGNDWFKKTENEIFWSPCIMYYGSWHYLYARTVSTWVLCFIARSKAFSHWWRWMLSTIALKTKPAWSKKFSASSKVICQLMQWIFRPMQQYLIVTSHDRHLSSSSLFKGQLLDVLYVVHLVCLLDGSVGHFCCVQVLCMYWHTCQTCP